MIIEYFLNGEVKTTNQAMTIDMMIAQYDYHQPSIAVAINETFIPRADYQTTEIKAGDRVEVVGPMQGG